MRRVFFKRAGLSGSPWVGFPGQTDSSTLATLSLHRDILRHIFILQRLFLLGEGRTDVCGQMIL